MIINPVLYQQGVKLPELENPGAAADLLAGKQLVDQYGNPITGTMPQKSASDLTASGSSIIVPAGYYPEQASKSVATATHPKPTLSRSGGTVTAKHVQSAGYTEGGTTTETLTIPTKSGATITPGTSRKTAVSSGYLTTGAVYVAGDTNLVAGNIKSGVSIFGVAGSAEIAQKSPVTIKSIGAGLALYEASSWQNIEQGTKSYDVPVNAYFYISGPAYIKIKTYSGVAIMFGVDDASGVFYGYLGSDGRIDQNMRVYICRITDTSDAFIELGT